MKRRALSELGLLPMDYYALTFGELDALLTGSRDRELANWRRVRKVATLLYNVNVEQKDRKTEAEFMPLDGDEQQAPKKTHTMPPQMMLGMMSELFNIPLKPTSE